MDKSPLHKKGRHTISAEQFPQWASERIAFHEEMIAALVGQTVALKYGVGMLTGFHPAPDVMLERWNEARLDLVDAEMGNPLYETEAYRNAFQNTMAFLTRTLEAATGREADSEG